MLAAVLLPALTLARPRAKRINCSNNLHQIGLAYKTWALDHNDKYFTQLSVTNHGALEVALAGNVARAFEVMSNELTSPKVLVCQVDPQRKAAMLFNGSMSNLNVSYFIDIDADDARPQMFMAGDRNITTNGVQLAPNAVHLLRTNTVVGWTAAMHQNNGNVLIVDGSAQQWNNLGLQNGLAQTGTTNRIAVP